MNTLFTFKLVTNISHFYLLGIRIFVWTFELPGRFTYLLLDSAAVMLRLSVGTTGWELGGAGRGPVTDTGMSAVGPDL